MAAVAPPSDSPKDDYDLGYGYVLRKDYALAEDTFQAFLKKYPSDRRAADAQFWLGESLFQRQRYDAAAQSFLDMSTKHDSHAKAPDALLRLGQSLAAMKQKEMACATLAEVGRKYPRRPPTVKQASSANRSVSAADGADALESAEVRSLFADLADHPVLFSPSRAAPTRPRCWCWPRAGARRESAGRSSSRSPSIMACGRRRGAKRSR